MENNTEDVKLPFVKWYPGDYLKDTAHLTTIQHGAYFLLLQAYWSNSGPIPMSRVIGTVKMTKRAWGRHKDPVLDFFETKEIDGIKYLVHKRVEKDIKEAIQRTIENKKRTERARKKRWDS